MAAIVLPPDAPDSTAGFNMTTTITPQNYAGPGPNVHSMAGPSLAQKQPQQQLYSDNTNFVGGDSISTAAGSESPEADAGEMQTQTTYDSHLVKHRRRTTPAQLEILDAHFKVCPKPDLPARKRLSMELGMTVREVQVWFQNRRAKQKKIDAKNADNPAHAGDASSKSSQSQHTVIPFPTGTDLESTLARYKVPHQQPSTTSYRTLGALPAPQQAQHTYPGPQPFPSYSMPGPSSSSSSLPSSYQRPTMPYHNGPYLQNVRPLLGSSTGANVSFAYPIPSGGHPRPAMFHRLSSGGVPSTVLSPSPTASPSTINSHPALSTPSLSTPSLSPDDILSQQNGMPPPYLPWQPPPQHQHRHHQLSRENSASSGSPVRTPNSVELSHRRIPSSNMSSDFASSTAEGLEGPSGSMLTSQYDGAYPHTRAAIFALENNDGNDDEPGPYTPLTPFDPLHPANGYPSHHGSYLDSQAPHHADHLPPSLHHPHSSIEQGYAGKAEHSYGFIDSFQNFQPYLSQHHPHTHARHLQQQQQYSKPTSSMLPLQSPIEMAPLPQSSYPRRDSIDLASGGSVHEYGGGPRPIPTPDYQSMHQNRLSSPAGSHPTTYGTSAGHEHRLQGSPPEGGLTHPHPHPPHHLHHQQYQYSPQQAFGQSGSSNIKDIPLAAARRASSASALEAIAEQSAATSSRSFSASVLQGYPSTIPDENEEEPGTTNVVASPTSPSRLSSSLTSTSPLPTSRRGSFAHTSGPVAVKKMRSGSSLYSPYPTPHSAKG